MCVKFSFKTRTAESAVDLKKLRNDEILKRLVKDSIKKSERKETDSCAGKGVIIYVTATFGIVYYNAMLE